MKINKDNSMIECLHLDSAYMGLTVQNLMTISEGYNLLDIHNDQLLNDFQVKTWMKHNTDLKQSEAVTIFELIDIYASGFFDLEMFYFICSIIIAAKDHVEKDFINRHSRSIYNLFEVRMKGKMTHEQFVMVGWLFGYEKSTIDFFHQEFDVSKSKKISYEDFKLYALICIELQDMIEGAERIAAFHKYRQRLVMALKPKLVKYVKYDIAPRPTRLIKQIRLVQRPYIRKGRGVHPLNPFQRVRKSVQRRWMMMTNTCHSKKKCGCQSTKKGEGNGKGKSIGQQQQKQKQRKCSLIRCFRCCSHKIPDKRDKSQHLDASSQVTRMPNWILKLDKMKKKRSHQQLDQFQTNQNENNSVVDKSEQHLVNPDEQKNLVIETTNSPVIETTNPPVNNVNLPSPPPPLVIKKVEKAKEKKELKKNKKVTF